MTRPRNPTQHSQIVKRLCKDGEREVGEEGGREGWRKGEKESVCE